MRSRVASRLGLRIERSWGTTFASYSASLHPGVLVITSEFNAGGRVVTLRWTSILLVVLCYSFQRNTLLVIDINQLCLLLFQFITNKEIFLCKPPQWKERQSSPPPGGKGEGNKCRSWAHDPLINTPASVVQESTRWYLYSRIWSSIKFSCTCDFSYR